MILYKYQGAGNDFLIADGRTEPFDGIASQIPLLCDRRYGIGADGFMVLRSSDKAGFRMEYYNSDGSGGMMCGNGGRCIAAFAADMGIAALDFEAPDGMHQAVILAEAGREKTISLKMMDVSVAERLDEGEYYIFTGTRHYVRICPDADKADVTGEGRKIRFSGWFAPEGVNVNFVSKSRSEDGEEILKVRTYEKGVEAETYACGTGITASAIAAFLYDNHAAFQGLSQMPVSSGNPLSPGLSVLQGRPVSYPVRALRDNLSVRFTPGKDIMTDVWLTGPATYVAKIEL